MLRKGGGGPCGGGLNETCKQCLLNYLPKFNNVITAEDAMIKKHFYWSNKTQKYFASDPTGFLS